MRRPVTLIATLIAAFALLGLSAVFLTAASGSAGKADGQGEGAGYTASADYMLAVPVIDLGDGWQTTLEIQNAGSAPTFARIEFFGAAEAGCPTTPSRPLAVQCVGPIPAGASRTFDVTGDPTLAEARSAIVHSVRSGDGGCRSSPGEPLAVVVRRTQASGAEEPGATNGTYVGIAPAVAGFWDADLKAYATVIPWVEISGTKQTILNIQNIGLECAGETQLELLSGPFCIPRQVDLPAIPPGQAIRVNVADLVTGSFSGSAWIRSPQPLAVVVDRRLGGDAMLSTHATGRAVAHQAVDAPLIQADGDGRITAARSQNASTRITALVELAYRVSEVTPTLKSQALICPGGSTSVEVSATSNLTLPFTGTLSLRSQGADPEQPEIPPLAVDVDLLDAGTGAAYHASNWITSTLMAPDIALPWLTRAYHPPAVSPGLTYTSRIAVLNQAEGGEGFISLSFYDPDGSLRTYQPEAPLRPRAMQIIDLADIPDLPANWHGSAVLQFLSLEPGAGAAVTVLETASGASGDSVSAYSGIVTRVQAQPTPTPQPTATVTPTATATLEPTATPATAQPTPFPDTYLPLLRR